MDITSSQLITNSVDATAMQSEVPSTSDARPGRLITALTWWMVVSFTVGAVTKFLPGPTFFGPPYSVKFVDWGYPAWFRFVVGAGELVGAALLIIPQSRMAWPTVGLGGLHAPSGRFLGACLLGVITAGATITHIANHNSIGQSMAAPVHLLLSLVLAWAFRPRRRAVATPT